MNVGGHHTKQARDATLGDDLGRVATESGISRRTLFRYGSGTAVIAGIGLAGMLELLDDREAIAAGMVLGIHGITREPDEAEETPHRHAFSAVFRVTSVGPSAIMGDVSGRTSRVISTGPDREDQHFHRIKGTDVALEELLLSGTEDDEPGEHSHLVSLE
jgi:hypothetical protein